MGGSLGEPEHLAHDRLLLRDCPRFSEHLAQAKPHEDVAGCGQRLGHALDHAQRDRGDAKRLDLSGDQSNGLVAGGSARSRENEMNVIREEHFRHLPCRPCDETLGLGSDQVTHHPNMPGGDLPDLTRRRQLTQPLKREHAVHVPVGGTVVVVVVRDTQLPDIDVARHDPK